MLTRTVEVLSVLRLSTRTVEVLSVLRLSTRTVEVLSVLRLSIWCAAQPYVQVTPGNVISYAVIELTDVCLYTKHFFHKIDKFPLESLRI
jgi:hypothetical protein